VILDSANVLKVNGIVDANTDVLKTVNELIDPTFTERGRRGQVAEMNGLASVLSRSIFHDRRSNGTQNRGSFADGG